MLISNLQPVQEAYFGKTKNLLEAERVLAKIINKLKLKKIEDYPKRVTDVAIALNKSKENKELCELFRKQFGFKEMVIHWDGQMEVNAFSFSRGIIKMVNEDMPRLPVKQSDGGYYDNSHNYLCCVNVYAGMIDIGCTPGEIMACILHEIGHNFQCTPMHNIFCVTDYLWIPVYFRNAIKRYAEFAKLSVSQLPKDQLKALWKLYAAYEWLNRTGTAIVSRLWSEFASENAKEAFAEFDAWVTKNKNRLKEELAEQVKELKKRREETKKDKDVFATGMVFNIFTTLATQVALGIISPTTFANQMYEAQSGYTGEVFADSFATAYGYGSETVSLQQRLEKMNTNNKYFKKDNKYNVYNQYLLCMMEVMFTFLDPHPMTQTRIKNQINKLRKELNSEEVPPQLKVLIEKDLQKAEKLYEEYLKMSPAEKHLSVIINFRNINETYFGGKLELRDLINRMLNFGKAEA